MLISSKGLEKLKEFEGFKRDAYRDVVGIWTIGYGNTVYTNGEPVKEGDRITKKEAERLMVAVLDGFEQAINDLVTVPLTQPAFDALCSFVYNVGVNAFKKSTMLRKLNAGDYSGAHAEFGRWIYGSNGQPIQGLINRREQEAEMFKPKKALLLVQGINEGKYIKDEVLQSNFDTSSFDKIKVIDTEGIYDRSKKNPLLFWRRNKIWDKYGDVIQFYVTPFSNKRKAICRRIRDRVKALQGEGYEVSVLAHSLGTTMVMSSKVRIHDFYCFGSPVGFFIGFLRGFILNHLKRFIKHFSVVNFMFCSSPNDKVCSKLTKGFFKLVNKANVGIFSNYNLQSNHDLTDYLNEFTQARAQGQIDTH